MIDEAKAARRREIIEVAFQEFAEKGYAGASMGAIARRARASKETLYAWFSNKETLLREVFASRLEGMTARVGQVPSDDPQPARVLPIAAENLVGFLLATAPLVQGLGVSGPDDQARRLLRESIQEQRRNFVAYLERCRAHGDIAFDDDPFEIASLFVAMAEGEWSLRLSTGMVSEITPAMIREHAERVTRVFLKGLAP